MFHIIQLYTVLENIQAQYISCDALQVMVHILITSPIKFNPGYMSGNPHYFAIDNINQIKPILNLYFASSFPYLPWAFVSR